MKQFAYDHLPHVGARLSMALHGKLYVWFNSFLAKDIAGVTEPITEGPNKGKTAIRLPLSSKLINTRALGRDIAYLTDQRGFSSFIGASSRLQTIAIFDLDVLGQMAIAHYTYGTTEVDLSDGRTLRKQDADVSKCKHSSVRAATYELIEAIPGKQMARNAIDTRPQNALKESAIYWGSGKYWYQPSRTGMLVKIHGAASDPLVTAAPDLNYGIHFAIAVDHPAETILVRVFGEVDGLVDVEAYAEYDKKIQTVFRYEHEEGDTLYSLIRWERRGVQGGAKFHQK